MISRLTLAAAVSSTLAAASIAYAAGTVGTPRTESGAAARPVRIVELPRVVVTARRLPLTMSAQR